MKSTSLSGRGWTRVRPLAAGVVIAGSLIAAVGMAPFADATCGGPGRTNDEHRGGCILPIPSVPSSVVPLVPVLTPAPVIPTFR